MPTLFEEIDAAAGTKSAGGKSLFDEIDDAAKAPVSAPVERRIAGRTVRTPLEGAKAILSGFTPGAVKESVFAASEPAAPVQDIVAKSEQAVKDAPPGSIEEKLALAGLFAGSFAAPLTAPAGVLGLGTTGLATQVAKNAPKLLPLARTTAAGVNAAMAAPMAETAGAMAGEASVEPTAANIGATLGTAAMAILGGLGVAHELLARTPAVFKPGAEAAINARAAQASKDTAARFQKAFEAEAAANNTRAADFLKAKAELHAQAAADIETAMTQNQIGTGESTVLTGTPEQNRLNILDTKPGEALRERARLTKPPLAVDEGGIPATTDLSRQAQDVAAAEGEALPLAAKRVRSFYRMRNDRPDRPNGYPDFGGDLNPVENPLSLESATLDQQAQEAAAAREKGKVLAQREAIATKADKPLVGDSSNVGQGQLLAGDEDFFSGESMETREKRSGPQAGFIDPRFVLSAPVQGALGATSGALYGSGQGDTPEERRANMLKFGGAGALIGMGVGLGARGLLGKGAATSKYRDYVKELAQGTEGMPAWYLKTRTIEPIVKFREQFVGTAGSATRIKDVLAENPADVPDAINPYLGRRLFPGKVTSRIELDVEKPMNTVITNRDAAAIQWAKRTGGSSEDFNRYFQEYAVAKTAKDYNFHNADYDPTKPASGMTDLEADTIVADAVANGTEPVFEDLRRQLRVIDETYLDILRDGQLIAQADVDALRAKYPEHIPLQRVLEEMNPDDALGSVYSTPKFGMKSAGIKGAYGSDLPIADVFDSVLANVKDAMIRAERNTQGVVTANYFEKYPTPEVTVDRAPVEGTRSDGSPIYRQPDNNTTLVTKRLNPAGNIELVYVDFKDPLLAKAFNGLNVEKTQPILRIVSKLTNALGSLYTAGSLDFKLPNKLRDMQEASTTIATSGDAKAAAQIPLRALQDMKAVSDFIREKPTAGAAAYEAMKREGGFVGGLASSTREAADKSVKHMGLTGPLTRTVDAVTGFYKFLDQVAEDSTRLTAGRTAESVGATPMESALASRESGVDFNLSGAGTKQLGAFYKFINPSIMGTTRAVKALVRNPGTIGAAATAFVGTGLLVDSWNKTFDPDWKKHRAMQWYRTNSMPLIIGEDADNYLVFTPPVAQMLRPVKGLADIGIDAASGGLESGQEAAVRARQVVNDSMNPFGGSSLRQSLTPTLADPFSDIVANESYSGGKIFPEQGPQDPMFSKVFDRTLTTTSGQLSIDGARVLHRMGFEISPEALTYLVRGYGGGPLQTASQGLALAKGAAGSGDLGWRDVPVLGRFIHQVPKDSPITRGPEQRALGEVRDIAGEEKMALRRRTLQTIESFKTKGADEIAADLTRLKKTDPDLIKAMTSELLSSTHDSIDKQLLQMNPVSRARYIDGQLQKMKPDEQLAYVNRLSTGPQPVITKAVRQELAALIEQQMAVPAGKN